MPIYHQKRSKFYSKCTIFYKKIKINKYINFFYKYIYLRKGFTYAFKNICFFSTKSKLFLFIIFKNTIERV